jgi:anti-anti-sigma factor
VSRVDQVPRWEGPAGTVHVSVDVAAVRVLLAGDIDAELDDELDEAVRIVRDNALPVVVDAARVRFMDSAGARFIGRCYAHSSVTVAASPQVRLLLQVLAMDDVLTGQEPH